MAVVDPEARDYGVYQGSSAATDRIPRPMHQPAFRPVVCGVSQTFAGDWAEGQRAGQGTHTREDGFEYKGGFQNDVYHGTGKASWPQTGGIPQFGGQRLQQYDGEWGGGEPHGTCVYSVRLPAFAHKLADGALHEHPSDGGFPCNQAKERRRLQTEMFTLATGSMDCVPATALASMPTVIDMKGLGRRICATAKVRSRSRMAPR